MRPSLLLLAILVCSNLFPQDKYPQDEFRSPVDIPIVLAGTFGELRSNHFHSGIDIKTQRRQGLPMYAIGDGTITRIKISHWGFGKALYIAHPNGYTSVYAHLQKFGPEIEEYIKSIQYKKQSYEVEVFPDFGEIEVKKGDVIAFGGNTGSSAGPHLHFEIRSSITEKPTNPLLYGYEVADATDPSFISLYGYPLSEGAHINQSGKKTKLNFSKQPDGTLLASKVSAHGTIGFGFAGFDRQDLAANKNGIYSLKQTVNGKVYTEYDFETFSFGETRYINTLIDYEHFRKYRQRIQKCFKENSNKLSIYKKLYLDGKIPVVEGMSYNVELLLTDIMGNETKVIIPVEGEVKPIKIFPEKEITEYYVERKKPASFDLGLAKVYFPANTFYKDFYLDLEKGNDTIRVHNKTVAAHRNFTLNFNVSKYSSDEKKKLFVARLDEDDLEANYTKTYKKGDVFVTRTRNFGLYTLAMDSIAPTVKPRNFREKEWLSNYRYLSLEISDDLSGINEYNAYLNGKWILMEYEPKNRTLTYNFADDIAKEPKCELKVIVTDNVGNSTTFESTFFRK
ncbi:M23 family metallopeptidase [Croceivirga thetidis]|uniref:M23 family metallopeptidase n=1 Tax=Croceivirga thetidis TaxID=2721623 RepID=A0ABX1GSD1_9FLAO|nr:M23 family metallopeptidase [Croceivirga thetidis]NKI32858.1 M23 family metallopeptidase [Croceivirga thetidis]